MNLNNLDSLVIGDLFHQDTFLNDAFEFFKNAKLMDFPLGRIGEIKGDFLSCFKSLTLPKMILSPWNLNTGRMNPAILDNKCVYFIKSHSKNDINSLDLGLMSSSEHEHLGVTDVKNLILFESQSGDILLYKDGKLIYSVASKWHIAFSWLLDDSNTGSVIVRTNHQTRELLIDNKQVQKITTTNHNQGFGVEHPLISHDYIRTGDELLITSESFGSMRNKFNDRWLIVERELKDFNPFLMYDNCLIKWGYEYHLNGKLKSITNLNSNNVILEIPDF